MTRFLVLGAGLVAAPLVEYLNRKNSNQITIAGFTLDEAQILADKFSSVKAIQLDVSNQHELSKHIGGYNVVISLVPAPLHPLIAQICIQSKVHMVTASYQSDAMNALSEDAKQAGIIILNEIGLDPGIDHLAAMEIIDKVHDKDHEVESFVSWCGGIPAPDDDDNPLHYKFSWEPRGAILVLLNDALYLHNNQPMKVSGKDLMSWATPIEIDGLNLECYPNRESISYKDVYGINAVKDIIRGTLRYQGFCSIFQVVKDLELMQTDHNPVLNSISWKNYVLNLNKVDSLEKLQAKIKPRIWQALEWLGLFSDEMVEKKECSVDALCDLLLQKLKYSSHEKDMVLLQHKFVIRKANGSRYFISSTLKLIGDPTGYSAMAKTVGYPVAMAAQLIADDKIKDKGLLLPVSKDIYQPILNLLKIEGIEFEEIQLIDKEMSKDKFLTEL